MSLKVSVIICNYNYDQYISDAIDSVIEQTYDNYELIIVDDGSTDKSKEIIDSYIEENPELIRKIYKENEGQAAALCDGVLQAQGDVVVFLDSDDMFVPHKIATLVKYYETFDAGGVVHQGVVFGDEAGDNLGVGWPPYVTPTEPTLLNHKTVISDYNVEYFTSSCLSFHRDSALKVATQKGKYWDYKHYGDVYFDRPLYLVENIYFIPEKLTYYRIHGKSHHLKNIHSCSAIEPEKLIYFIEDQYRYVNNFLKKNNEMQINIEKNKMLNDLYVKCKRIEILNFIKNVIKSNNNINFKKKVIIRALKIRILSLLPGL